MLHSFTRQALALVLAVLVTLSLSLSAVQAGAVTMPRSTAMFGMSGGDAAECKDKDLRGGAMSLMCAALCAISGAGIVAPEAATFPARAASLYADQASRARDEVIPPDPHPPRAVLIA